MDLRERRVSKDLARDRFSLEVNFLKTVQRMPACKTDVKPKMMMMMMMMMMLKYFHRRLIILVCVSTLIICTVDYFIQLKT